MMLYLLWLNGRFWLIAVGFPIIGSPIEVICRVPDDRIAYRSYPLLAARELLQQFIRDQVHGHQAASRFSWVAGLRTVWVSVAGGLGQGGVSAGRGQP